MLRWTSVREGGLVRLSKKPPQAKFPKCMVQCDGMRLLERHRQMLETAGVTDVVLALGFQPESVQAELERINWPHKVETVLNPRYDLGSVLTVHTVAEPLTRGGDVLLMDADVLYHEGIMTALVAGEKSVNRILIDRNFEPGEEPVKVCISDGVPVEFRKQLAPDLRYDTIGESVGFFRFSAAG